ncbi:MAG: carboxymethylenebutenolidase [Parvibaculum sp.]|jgi:carboxymethylenebutenolidase|nr:carboxymethylenebutenolidase [Parvibaculum sp.]|tara:strand:+ start:2945 stop:3643 length:699 start_codon:yes stop_codon:yes gene_type:complete
MSSETITINGPDGSFSGYLAKPEGDGPFPAIVVIQEIFGVNAVMRGICDDLAKQGYLALSPDLFWRIEPGVDITDQSEEEWAKAFELFNAFDVDKGMVDVQATIDAARKLPGANGKVGAVGYCLGGQLAYLTAARTDADAAVGFYGVNLQNLTGEASNISKPLMLHIAGKDEFVPADAQAAIHAGLDNHARVTLHDYPERDHAFARVGGAHYDKGDADLANGRTLEFFKANL